MDHENQIRILKSGVKLVKSDLIDLSKVAKEKNLYDKAIMFIMVIWVVKFSSGDTKLERFCDFWKNPGHHIFFEIF